MGTIGVDEFVDGFVGALSDAGVAVQTPADDRSRVT